MGDLENYLDPMLLILIPVIWLAVAAFVVLLCRAVADADSVLLASAEPERISPHTALVPV